MFLIQDANEDVRHVAESQPHANAEWVLRVSCQHGESAPGDRVSLHSQHAPDSPERCLPNIMQHVHRRV